MAENKGENGEYIPPPDGAINGGLLHFLGNCRKQSDHATANAAAGSFPTTDAAIASRR